MNMKGLKTLKKLTKNISLSEVANLLNDDFVLKD